MLIRNAVSAMALIAGGGGAAPVISAVAADGITATSVNLLVAREPDISVNVTRKGYDGTYTVIGGVPTPTLKTNIVDEFKLRHQVRNVYPDNPVSTPTWATNTAVLNDWTYTSDSGSFTGGSTETSPKPTCGWLTTDREIVGDTLKLQIVVFHRDARNRQQCAIAVFRVTDGTTTVYATATTTQILSFPGGVHPNAGVRAQGFEVDIDISSLANPSDITANAKVYPWIGDAATNSVADSASSANLYEFSPLTFRRNTAKYASPPLAYWSSTGVDATVDANGASGGNTKVSTNAATAAANPFLTLKSAYEALKAATNVTGGFTDGCEIRVMNAVSLPATTVLVGTYQQTACCTITRDPNTTRALAEITMSGAASFRSGWLKLKDCTFKRTANVTLSTGGVGTAPKVIFENITYDNGGFSSSPVGGSNSLYWVGVSVLNCASSVWSAGGVGNHLIRGCTVVNGTFSRPEAGVVVENSFSSTGVTMASGGVARQATRSIVAFNRFSIGNGPAVVNDFNSPHQVFASNLVEYTSAVTSSVSFSADGATYSAVGLIFVNNTFAGAFQCGRCNFLYDETVGTYRDHKLIRVAGNVFVQWTTKTDYFLGENAGAAAAEVALHTKGQNVLYGVGIDENHCQWPDANVVGYGTDSVPRLWGNYAPYTLGRNSSRPNGADGFVEYHNTARFKAPTATTYTPGGTPNTGTHFAGAAGGDYRPMRLSQGDAFDSPLLGKIANPRFRYDLAGTERAAVNDTIGCYA